MGIIDFFLSNSWKEYHEVKVMRQIEKKIKNLSPEDIKKIIKSKK
jgi:hypothetical protein